MKLADLIKDSDAAKQKKKLFAVYAIIVTVVVLVALIVTLCITSIVLDSKDNGDDISADTNDANDSYTGIPTGYVETTFDTTQLYSGSLILVNEENPVNAASSNTYILLQNYENRPKTPKDSNTYTVDAKDSKATPDAADALNKMLGDYYTQNKDDNLVVHSASDSSCGMLFELVYFVNYTAGNQDLTKAGIYGVQKYNWIYENAYKYGFISLATKSADGKVENANIFRYVGAEHSTAMKQKNLSTLESYLNYLKADTSVSKPLSVNTDSGKMRIYFCAADATAYVSERNAYTVSGNNVDGYIITVNTSVKAEPAESTSQESQ